MLREFSIQANAKKKLDNDCFLFTHWNQLVAVRTRGLNCSFWAKILSRSDISLRFMWLRTYWAVRLNTKTERLSSCLIPTQKWEPAGQAGRWSEQTSLQESHSSHFIFTPFVWGRLWCMSASKKVGVANDEGKARLVLSCNRCPAFGRGTL